MKLDVTVVGKALDLAYDLAVDGVPSVPGLESAEGLAEDCLNDPMPLEDQVDVLIRYQVLKASASGFVTSTCRPWVSSFRFPAMATAVGSQGREQGIASLDFYSTRKTVAIRVVQKRRPEGS